MTAHLTICIIQVILCYHDASRDCFATYIMNCLAITKWQEERGVFLAQWGRADHSALGTSKTYVS